MREADDAPQLEHEAYPAAFLFVGHKKSAPPPEHAVGSRSGELGPLTAARSPKPISAPPSIAQAA